MVGVDVGWKWLDGQIRFVFCRKHQLHSQFSQYCQSSPNAPQHIWALINKRRAGNLINGGRTGSDNDERELDELVGTKN